MVMIIIIIIMILILKNEFIERSNLDYYALSAEHRTYPS